MTPNFEYVHPELLNSLKTVQVSDLDTNDLKKLAKEIRSKLLFDQKLSGFLGSCLGIVELTIALHKVFNLNKDHLFFDIGHQTLPHRYLEEAKGRPYIDDHIKSFVHKKPGQVLSEATASVIHRDLFQYSYEIVTIIGDRSLSSGQAFEALNHLGAIASKKIIIINDNLDENKNLVNGLSLYLNHLQPNHHHFEQHALFESLGFNYIGPIDGHNFDILLETLSYIKNYKEQTPIILHVKTKKGKGYTPAEIDSDGLNGALSFDIQSGRTLVKKVKTSTHYAAEMLIELAHKDPHVVVVTLQTPHLQFPFLAFRDLYPDRYFEVSVTERHAIAFSKALALNGLKPYLILNSAFISQLSDDLMYDISLQKPNLKIIIDHADIRHTGNPFVLKKYITGHLIDFKNFCIDFPYFVEDIEKSIVTSFNDIKNPHLIYLPKTHSTYGDDKIVLNETKPFKLLRKGNEKFALFAYGEIVEYALKLADLLNANGFSTTVYQVTSLEPFDFDGFIEIAKHIPYIFSLEEDGLGFLQKKIFSILNDQSMMNTKLFYKSLWIKNKDKAIFNPLPFLKEIRNAIQNKPYDEDFISVA
ncbi:MAG: hypothetical protein KBD31_03365 [Proteobacteria bacterium]|nr:hypothetical protein [Pseudomonadota bacterium]